MDDAMKTLITLSLGLLLSGWVSAADIEFLTPELIDHGRVQEGTECTGIIRFANIGDRSITITKVAAGCGCTAATLDKNRLAPGDTANIQYVLRTKQYSGVMRKAVTVFLDHADVPRRRYILQADVFTDILFHPKYIHFRRITVNPDTLVTETLVVNNKSDHPLVCHNIYTNNDALRATPKETVIQAGERGEIQVSLTPSKAGRWTYYLHIDTNHKLKSNIRIPVFTRVYE